MVLILPMFFCFSLRFYCIFYKETLNVIVKKGSWTYKGIYGKMYADIVGYVVMYLEIPCLWFLEYMFVIRVILCDFFECMMDVTFRCFCLKTELVSLQNAGVFANVVLILAMLQVGNWESTITMSKEKKMEQCILCPLLLRVCYLCRSRRLVWSLQNNFKPNGHFFEL